MLRLFFFAILLFVYGQLTAQSLNPGLDSIAAVAYDLVFDEPEAGLRLSTDLLNRSQEADYSTGIAKANLALGIFYRTRGAYEIALDHFDKTYRLIDFLDEGKLNKGIFYQYYGEVFENIGDVDQAESHYLSGLDYLSGAGKVQQEVTCRILLGIFYGRRGQYEKSLSQFTQGLEITLDRDTTDLKVRRQLIDLYNDLGMLYNLTDEPIKAKEFSKSSLKVASTHPKMRPPIFNTLAQIQVSLGELDSALLYYRKSYQIAKKEGLSEYVAATAQDISGLFSKDLRQPDSARHYLKEAIVYTKRLNDVTEVSALQFALANFYFAIAKYDSAYHYSHIGIPVFEEQRDFFMLQNTYNVLWQASNRLGRTQEALDYLLKHKAFSDSVANASNDRNYSNLRIRLETLEKQRQVDELQGQLLIRKTQLIGFSIIVALIVVIGLVYWLWMRAENRRKKLDLAHSELKRKSYQDQLEMREQELADHALHMIRKNQFIEEIEAIAKDSLKRNEDQNNLSKRLIKSINLNKSAERDWEDFAKYFGQVHAGFFDVLKNRYPKLTSGELRHCALVKMNMSLKESSEIMGVEPSSIKVARYRIKKKLGLSESDSLQSFLAQSFQSLEVEQG